MYVDSICIQTKTLYNIIFVLLAYVFNDTIMEKSKKVIGYVSSSNPMMDRKAWSGTLFKLREAIENAGYDVIWIKIHPNKFISLVVKAIIKLFVGGVKYWEYSKVYYWLCAKSINMNEVMKCDYLFFPGGAQVMAYLKNSSFVLPPAIYYTDSCFRMMINYYWYDIPNWLCRQADALEKNALEESALVIRSSDWAINCAIKEYGCLERKTEVLEFGANIDEKYIVTTEPYRGGELRLLFSGVDWKRKGCDIAIETVRLLNEDGINAKLYLVGLDLLKIPSEYHNLNFVEYVGFLNKNDPDQYRRYTDVIAKCHCLLLPTHAECSGIVFCEASAYGLPSISYDTGGVGNYVINGKTGYRLDTHSTAEDFANVIKEIINRKEFDRLHNGALTYYKNKVNWSTWSDRFAKIMDIHFNNKTSLHLFSS